jgi:ribulose-bisphosphate carboxylase small chain
MATEPALVPRADPPAAHRLGTFSYLPPLSHDQIIRQIDHILGQGWTASVEHVEPANALQTYWHLWKLPFFGIRDSADVMHEIDACRQAHPGHHVRLVGYDSRRQTQGLAFAVHRGEPG